MEGWRTRIGFPVPPGNPTVGPAMVEMSPHQGLRRVPVVNGAPRCSQIRQQADITSISASRFALDS